MIKAIFFDLDDTLLWDARSVDVAFKNTCNHAAKQYGIDALAMEKRVRKLAHAQYATYDTYPFVKKIGIGTFEGLWGEFHDEGEAFQRLREVVPNYRNTVWTKGLERMGIDNEAFGKMLARMFQEERRKHPYVFADTYSVLDRLKGKYKLLLLTNGSPDLQWTKLKMTPELIGYFDHIVISGAFGEGKPSAAIFQHALDLCSVTKDEAIMIGDNLMTDILGASTIGMKSVWINHHGKKSDEVTPAHEMKRLGELLPIIENMEKGCPNSE